MAKLLIVDDEKNTRLSLVQFFDSLGHQVSEAEDGARAAALVAQSHFDLVLTDFRMGRMNGLQLLEEVRRIHPDSLGILMTAYASVEHAVAAIRAGAHDYVSKPFSLEQIQLIVERAIQVQELRGQHRASREVPDEVPLLVSRSPAMRHLLESALQAALSEDTVLLLGESGTGKSVIARQIHQWSPRRDRPFIEVNCTTLAGHLLESELFGDARESFSGAVKDQPGRLEAADGGSIFLDEIADLSAHLQSKFLSFLKEPSFQPLGEAYRSRRRPDHRGVQSSPRGGSRGAPFSRGSLLSPQCHHAAGAAIARPARRYPAAGGVDAQICQSPQSAAGALASPAAASALSKHQWPGNLRELRNSLEHAALLTRGEVIQADDLPDALFREGLDTSHGSRHSGSLEDVERAHIRRVLEESSTLDEAAATLGINAATLWRKRKRYSIE